MIIERVRVYVCMCDNNEVKFNIYLLRNLQWSIHLISFFYYGCRIDRFQRQKILGTKVPELSDNFVCLFKAIHIHTCSILSRLLFLFVLFVSSI